MARMEKVGANRTAAFARVPSSTAGVGSRSRLANGDRRMRMSPEVTKSSANDDLDAARGLILGALLGPIMWACILMLF